MRDDEFEWDDRKAASNRRKHGVSFDEARQVFRDLTAVDRPDLGEDYGEDRYLIIGQADSGLLAVVYTERDPRIRIISARPATRKEHDDYVQAQDEGL